MLLTVFSKYAGHVYTHIYVQYIQCTCSTDIGTSSQEILATSRSCFKWSPVLRGHFCDFQWVCGRPTLALSSALDYHKLNFDFYVSKIMHL